MSSRQNRLDDTEKQKMSKEISSRDDEKIVIRFDFIVVSF